MGFTNVAWESRSTERLARDLTEGPGPSSAGDAGAAWIRVANELAGVSADFDKILERFKSANESQGSTAALSRLEEFGKWLRGASLSAAANGQRAEAAAVANTVAVLAMPTVPEAIEARAAQDMMASLAAYNGAVLTGRFAEFDERATADQANAAAVMQQYEEACSVFAQPWDQALPPTVANGTAQGAEAGGSPNAGAATGTPVGAGGMAAAPAPLSPWKSNAPRASEDPRPMQRVTSAAGGGGSGMGTGGAPYAPMGALGRGGDAGGRDYESMQPAAALDGAGEPGAGLSDSGQGWLPAASQNEAPFTVSNVSWGPDTAVFDELAVPEESGTPEFADHPERTLEQVSDRWVAPPVIGMDKSPDKELTL